MNTIDIFLSGDVMTGRGIDQIFDHSNTPELYESYVKDARQYIELAERVNGPIRRPVSPSYIWGEAMILMKKADLRIINLETTITTSNNYAEKGINYRMHPANVNCLKEANIDCCALANNHILDWGVEGLKETITTLKEAGIAGAGVGENLLEASSPAVLNVAGKGRVLVFSCGFSSSGISSHWGASAQKSGLYYFQDLSEKTVHSIRDHINKYKKTNDLVVFSVHWGGNWGYSITKARRDFAHQLIDICGVDIIHGHSSHHVLGLEVYKDKPILYGCGDLINDYEGISGHDAYKPHIGALYFIRFNVDNGKLISLELMPTEIRKFRLHLARQSFSKRLLKILNRESMQFSTEFHELTNHVLAVKI